MQNISGLSTPTCPYSGDFSSKQTGLIKFITRRIFSRQRLNKIRSGAIELLTALAIGGVFLGGAYFFLVQLARYGW